MKFDTITVAIHKESKQAYYFAGKFHPLMETKTAQHPARFKFWPVNCLLEKIGKAKTVSWNDNGNSQAEQLQMALGDNWRVLTQYETLQAVVMGAKQMGVYKATPFDSSTYSKAFDKFRKEQGYVNLEETY